MSPLADAVLAQFFSPEFIGVVLVAIIGLIGTMALVSGQRGKTKEDSRSAFQKLVDDRVKLILERSDLDFNRLKDEQKDTQRRLTELEEQVRKTEANIRELRQREVQKTAVFQRIFNTLAAMLPNIPNLELTTEEIRLVEDTLPADWLEHHRKDI